MAINIYNYVRNEEIVFYFQRKKKAFFFLAENLEN